MAKSAQIFSSVIRCYITSHPKMQLLKAGTKAHGSMIHGLG